MILFAAFAMLALMVSCSEDDYVCDCAKNSTSILDTIINTQYLDSMSNHSMPIYLGNNPKIWFGGADTFRFNPIVMTYSNLLSDQAIVGNTEYYPGLNEDCYFIISNQTADQHITVRKIEHFTLNGALYKTDEKAVGVITGNSDGYFTIYVDEMGTVISSGTTINYKQPITISGKWTSQGIQDCMMSIIMQQKTNDINGILDKIGTMKIYRDTDGMAYYATLPLGWGKIAPEK